MTGPAHSPVWRPFTQHALQPDAVKIARAEGAWLEAEDGARFLDAISSWWVITHGHRQPQIMQAIRDQTEKLDQLIFAGFTHEPAETLARRLVEITQPGLDYVFYSDSGSTCVEVAIKMALGYWRHRGEDRTRIIALEHAYHGDTIGAMSTGARSAFNEIYAPVLFDVARIPFPAQGVEQQTLDALEGFCRTGAAAFVVEPLICGAGGMLIYSSQILAEMKNICARYGVLFIADEVMTGFGRTGSLFACEQANLVPDIACYSKGLTGGAIPLAVTMCRNEIFDAHYAPDRTRTFFHSSSFTANPISCSAAIANLDLLEEVATRERIANLCHMQKKCISNLSTNKFIKDIRNIGTITALDLKINNSNYLANVGLDIIRFFNSRGLVMRPIGSTIYVLPPYCVTDQDLNLIYDAIGDLIEALS
jgi:adenosylmethionine-8-amino-7-oxononanoate aminotransferase